ncbi:MAG: uroporphyrinogen decarboxylase family protein [Bacillota bacterium]
MKPKEILFNTIEGNKSERIPWVPFVGCHGGKLLGVEAEDYLKDVDLIVEGVTKAIELYEPDGIPIIFDLQVEAEILGCELQWNKDNPPTVIGHPLNEGKNINDLNIPKRDEGRFPIILDAMQKINKDFGDEIALYGLITGPFTLGLHLLGSNIFMEMFDNPDNIIKLMNFTKEVAKKTAKLYIEAGMDVIALVDPMTSQISPNDFAKIVKPAVKEVFDYIEAKGAYSSFFVCGDAKQNIEEMCQSNPDNISIDENISLNYVKNISKKYNISFGGNMELTTVLLMGSPKKCKKHALECMDIGGEEGYILSPGCDIAYDTPIENIQAVSEVVHNKEAYDLLEDFQDIEEEEIDVELPDYENEEKVYIEIFTLDSKSCAPCQYMVNSVYEAISDEMKEKIYLKEYKIKEEESVARMKKLDVESIPSVLIDGKSKYEGTPNKQQLQEDIINKIKKKTQ